MNNITPEEVKKRLDAGEKLNLVDVREPAENQAFNIGGSLYPLGKIKDFDIQDIESLKDEEVILYCRFAYINEIKFFSGIKPLFLLLQV